MSSFTWQAGLSEAPEMPPRRTIPFDLAFRYELKGQPGNVINQTVTVSIEATFVAVSIGYGVIPKITTVVFGPTRPAGDGIPVATRRPPIMWITSKRAFPPPASVPFEDITLRSISLGDLMDALDPKLKETERLLKNESGPEAVLKSGIRLNPDLLERALLDGGNAPLDSGTLENLFQVVSAPPEQIQFLYALFDEGSGREFQSDPVLNTSGLGISTGERPFRQFAKPIVFAPQSKIRMQVTEISEFQGELHVSLQGYKALGGAGTPTGRIRQRLRKVATR